MARQALAPGEHGVVRFRQRKSKTTGEPDGKIYARFDYRSESGSRHQLERTGDSEAAAEAALMLAWDALFLAGVVGQEEWTDHTKLAVVIDAWLAEIAVSSLRPATIRQYGKVAGKLRAGLGTLELRQLRVGRLKTFLLEVQRSTPSGWWGPQCKIVLTLVLDLAMDHDAITKNPARAIKLPALKAAESRSLTDAELASIETAVADYEEQRIGRPGPAPNGYLGDAVRILRGTGLRTNELLALRWGDIDFPAEKLTVSGILIAAAGPVIRQPMTKTVSGFRRLTLPPFVVGTLHNRFMRVKADAVRRGIVFNDETPVFQSRNGNWWRDTRLRGQFRAATGGLGIEGLELYSFRRTVATRLAEAHGNGYAAAAQLGHASPETTRRHYIQKASEAGDFRDELEGLG